MKKDTTNKISIIGRGVDPQRHLSLSALSALQASDKIIGIESEKIFWKSIQNQFNIREIEYVDNLYVNNARDHINYDRFVDHVLNLSSQFPHLSLLVAGHPLLGVTFIDLLKKRAPLELEIEIIEGISSFDTMITILELDPLEQGTVILDVNRLLLFQYTLETSLAYFIYHICSIGNSKTNYLNPSQNNRIDLLKKYLLKFYPPKKELALCRVANGEKELSSIIRITLEEFDDCISKIDYSTTLYIAPEKPQKIDWSYLELLR